VRGRLVLVGDAAHAMTPNLGRGGCEALLDAITLGRLLGELPTAAALSIYDRERVWPSQRLRVASGALMRVALAERMQPARDRLISSVGRRAARRSQVGDGDADRGQSGLQEARPVGQSTGRRRVSDSASEGG
jgi:2-polyprenyl-6-methoxyphenol hydroxylase-like FAD-dependent oxidoreductase